MFESRSAGFVRPRRRSAARYVAVAATAALFAAACGDSGDDAEEPSATDAAATTDGIAGSQAPTSSADSGPATTQGSAELLPVRFQDGPPGPSTFAIYLADTLGYFEEEGVDLQVNPGILDTSSIVQVVLNRDADVGTNGATGSLALSVAGQELVSLGSVVYGIPNQVLLTNDTLERLEADGVTVDSPIADRVEALRGLTLASPPVGSQTVADFRTLLDSFGLNPDSDLTLQPLPDVPAILTAVREGRVDGNVGSAGYTIPTEVEGDGQIFIDYPVDVPELFQKPQFMLSVHPDFPSDNPEAAEGFLRAILRSMETIRAGLTESQLDQLRETYYDSYDPVVFSRSIELTIPAVGDSLVPTQEQFDNLVAAFNQTAENPFEGTIDDIYDTSIAEQIQSES